MALKFNMQPYHPVATQDMNRGWEETGAVIGHALKQHQEKYGAENMAYNEWVARQPEGVDVPPKSTWLRSKDGINEVKRIEQEKLSKLANSPLGKLFVEQTGKTTQLKDIVDKRGLAKAEEYFEGLGTDYYGMSNEATGGFNPQKWGTDVWGQDFESSLRNAEGNLTKKELADLNNQPWYQDFKKDAKAGRWKGSVPVSGGNQKWWDMLVQGAVTPYLIYKGATEYAPNMAWNMSQAGGKGWEGLFGLGGFRGGKGEGAGIDVGSMTKEYGRGHEGFKNWLEDYYTTKGQEVGEYKMRNPLSALFGKKDSIPTRNAKMDKKGNGATSKAQTASTAQGGILGRLLNKLPSGQRVSSYRPPVTNQGASALPTTNIPQQYQGQPITNIVKQLADENEKLKKQVSIGGKLYTPGPGYYPGYNPHGANE